MSDLNWNQGLERIKGTALGKMERETWLLDERNAKHKDGSARRSKLGGTPWLAEDEEWPTCQNCGLPMALLVQIDLDQLPDAVGDRFGAGLIQVFYCFSTEPHCEVDAEAWVPESMKSKVARLVNPIGDLRKWETAREFGKRHVVQRPPGHSPRSDDLPSIKFEDPVQPTLLGGWERDVDYPDWQDARDHGVDDYEGCLALAGLAEVWQDAFPRDGIRLGGWPCWIQNNDWATCPVCGMQMTQMVIQLPHGSLPADRTLFGDCGNAYLVQCVQHREQLALVWQC